MNHFSVLLTSEQHQQIKSMWMQFETVIKQMPLSDTVTLLLFHARTLLEKCDENAVDMEALHLATTRVNVLVEQSHVALGIEDRTTALNDVLKEIIRDRPYDVTVR